MPQPSADNRVPCIHMLQALPIPVAVADREGQVVYVNPVYQKEDSAQAPCLNVEYFRRVTQTRSPVFFEVTCEGACCLCWLYTPVLNAEGEVDTVLLLGMDVTGVRRQAAAEARQTLVERIAHEIQVPLMALVGLTNSLAHELAGTQGERAVQIRRHGKFLLKQLRALLASASPLGPVDTPIPPSSG